MLQLRNSQSEEAVAIPDLLAPQESRENTPCAPDLHHHGHRHSQENENAPAVDHKNPIESHKRTLITNLVAKGMALCYVCGAEVAVEKQCDKCHLCVCREHRSKMGFFQTYYVCHPCCRPPKCPPDVLQELVDRFGLSQQTVVNAFTLMGGDMRKAMQLLGAKKSKNAPPSAPGAQAESITANPLRRDNAAPGAALVVRQPLKSLPGNDRRREPSCASAFVDVEDDAAPLPITAPAPPVVVSADAKHQQASCASLPTVVAPVPEPIIRNASASPEAQLKADEHFCEIPENSSRAHSRQSSTNRPPSSSNAAVSATKCMVGACNLKALPGISAKIYKTLPEEHHDNANSVKAAAVPPPHMNVQSAPPLLASKMPPPQPRKGVPPPPVGIAPPPLAGVAPLAKGVAGKAPPPPPPPCFGKAAAAPGGELPLQKTKSFFWEKVEDTSLLSEDSVWKTHEAAAESALDDAERARLEILFAKKGKPNADAKEGGALPPPTGPVGMTMLHLQNTQRDCNVGIVLQYLKMAPQEICDAIQSFDDGIQDKLSTILSICPTTEDLESVRALPPKVEGVKYSPALHFIIATQSIPYFEAKLRSWTTLNEFDACWEDVRDRVDAVRAATDGLRHQSPHFAQLLRFILALGNFLNQGSASLRNAKAFRISDLKKLSTVKSADGRQTMLEVVVQSITTKIPDINCFVEEVRPCFHARSVEFAALRADVKQLHTRLATCAQVEKHAKENNESAISAALGPFVGPATERLALLSNDMNAAMDDGTHLATFFGEKSEGFDPQTLFCDVWNFALEYQNVLAATATTQQKKK